MSLQWAGTQHDLGTVLLALGKRESGTARLEEAVAAFREALKERTREGWSLQWAGAQNGLADALSEQGARTRDKSLLRDALAAVEGALDVYRENKIAPEIVPAERLRSQIVAALQLN